MSSLSIKNKQSETNSLFFFDMVRWDEEYIYIQIDFKTIFWGPVQDGSLGKSWRLIPSHRHTKSTSMFWTIPSKKDLKTSLMVLSNKG